MEIRLFLTVTVIWSAAISLLVVGLTALKEARCAGITLLTLALVLGLITIPAAFKVEDVGPFFAMLGLIVVIISEVRLLILCIAYVKEREKTAGKRLKRKEQKRAYKVMVLARKKIAKENRSVIALEKEKARLVKMMIKGDELNQSREFNRLLDILTGSEIGVFHDFIRQEEKYQNRVKEINHWFSALAEQYRIIGDTENLTKYWNLTK